MACPSGSIGYECVLTIGGSTVIGYAQDVDGPNASADEAEVTTRAGDGWKEFKQGLKEWDASLEHLWIATDAGLQALRTAFTAGSCVAASFLDSDGNGWSGYCIVTSLGFGQALSEGVSFPVGLKGTGALTVVGEGS